MLLLFAKFVAAFSAYGKPIQIAFAMAMGLVLALIPGGTLLWFLLLIPMMLIRINQAAMLGTMGVFRLLTSLLDPLSENFGYYLLNQPFMEDSMTRILSVPAASWLRLNDSFVFGGFVLGVLGLPVYILIFTLIVILSRRYIAGPVKRFFGKIGSKVPWLKKLSGLVNTARRVGVA